MSKTQKALKKFEKQLASNVSHGFGAFMRRTGGFFVKIFKVFDNKLTIMIVPHSQNKVINFQTNVFALVLGLLVSIGVIASFFYYNRRSISANMEISSLDAQNRATLASLDELRDDARRKLRVPASYGEHAVSERHLSAREFLDRANVRVVIAEQTLNIYLFRYV